MSAVEIIGSKFPENDPIKNITNKLKSEMIRRFYEVWICFVLFVICDLGKQ